MLETRGPDTLERIGGKLCLDFVNTVSWRVSTHPFEWLQSYGDLLSWCQSAGVLASDRAGLLVAEAVRHPEAVAVRYLEATTFREALFRLFLAVIEKGSVLEQDLRLLNSVHREMRAHLHFEQFEETSTGFHLVWSAETPPLELPVWTIAQSAGELLTSAELERVSLCAGPECSWLFFDHSKNHSRKWCDGADCGNRVRVRRHYQKKQKK